jgi:hypothetical protein
MPESCEGCCEGVEVLGKPDRRRGWGYRVNKRRGGAMASKRGTCKGCSRELTIVGRGLCGRCYAAARKSELEANVEGEAPAPSPVIGGTGTTPAEIHAEIDAPHSRVEQERPEPAALWSLKLGEAPHQDPDGAPLLTLRFEPEDVPLLEALEEAARADRRSPDQQLLWILDRVLQMGTAQLAAQL